MVAFVGYAIPLAALGHTTGASWNAPSGKYTVDVGYDPAVFVAGQYTRFDFLLWKGPVNTGDPANYAQIWVRVLHSGRTILATGIWKQPVGPTTLLYQFEEPGTYTLETSYRNEDGDDIATASFPITVAAGERTVTVLPFAIGFVSFVVGAAACFIGMRARALKQI